MQMDLGGPMNAHETETTTRPGLGRRTVLKGAAWSVPAVVAVGVTPAFAQTGEQIPIFESVGLTADRGRQQTQTAGNITYAWTFKSNATETVTINLIETDTPPGWTSLGVTEFPTSVGAGQNSTPVSISGVKAAPANGATLPGFTITITFNGTQTATFGVASHDLAQNANDAVLSSFVTPGTVPTI